MKSIADSHASLKQVLIEHKGDTSLKPVHDVIEEFQKLAADERGSTKWNATQDPIIHTGRWHVLTAPPFPGRLSDDEEGRARYTLGRMSFNMFKPTNVLCSVIDIINIVDKVEDDDEKGDSSWKRTYNLEVVMEIAVPSDDNDANASPAIKLPAKLTNYGICTPASDSRLAVKFTSGVLKPNFDLTLDENKTLTLAWEKMFDGAIEKEFKSQSSMKKLGTAAGNGMMKLMMGLTPPVDCEDLTQTYSIARPIPGHLDVLYLDKDIRITKGNRGTIVVVEKVFVDDI